MDEYEYDPDNELDSSGYLSDDDNIFYEEWGELSSDEEELPANESLERRNFAYSLFRIYGERFLDVLFGRISKTIGKSMDEYVYYPDDELDSSGYLSDDDNNITYEQWGEDSNDAEEEELTANESLETGYFAWTIFRIFGFHINLILHIRFRH